MDLRSWLDAAREPDPWIVETSGSTGAPKRVRLTRRAVLASVRATERRLGGSGQWVLRVPETYVAGLMVVARSLTAGPEPVGADDPWPETDRWFTSLVPTQLHRMLDEPREAEALRRAHTVLLGGGPIPAGLRERAHAEGIRTVATYGMAETCGGCVYDGVPLDGVGVALETDGRIRIGGPTLFAGYDADPTATDAALVDGWFRTSDAGRLDEDGRLQVLGRLDDMVITGGVNVPAPAVARRLREHPDVEQAEVLGVDDEEWGQRLVAFVVGDLTLDQARAWVGEAHPRSWAPKQVVALDAIPHVPNGKPDRVRLRELAT